METGALYIRVSTDEQTEYSPDAQRKALLEYAKKNKIRVPAEFIFVDEGISGRKAEKRPAFMEMICLAKKKPKLFDVILVHKYDRFARSREDSVVYKSLLRKDCGIKVISITEQMEDDKFSIILESMLEAMAEYYSLNLSDEVKKGMTEKARRGELQATPSYGYEPKDNTLVILEEEAKIIRYIFDQFLNHDESFYRIAKKVNEMGTLTKRGNPFENRGIEYILRNPVYIGKLRWTPSGRIRRDFDSDESLIIESNHEPIIPIEVFEAVQEKIRTREKRKRPKQRPLDECKHWLSGLIRCSNCNATLVYTGARSPGFQCRGYSGGKCKVSHRVSVPKLEKALLDELHEIITDANLKGYNIRQMNTETLEIEALEKLLIKIPAKLERAKQAFLAEIDTIEEYKINKDAIVQEENQLKSKIKELKKINGKTNTKKFLTNAEIVYNILSSENMPLIEKQKSVRTIIEKMIFDRSSNDLEVYYLDN